ncbi:PDR/VanB family oxidoreductase [Aliisedimentitalea scapharcae]|uniref:PDR/VanB family oxidoreductase n=1 Tax=Aliisedimentitalea scapharcae TaxID=1524259 RepID=A0ABZ2XXT5_9RHOB
MTLKLTLLDKTPVTDSISLFRFAPADGEELSGYAAGAHVDFDMGAPGLRSYSLIDFVAPSGGPDTYSVAVQREDKGQGGSVAMHALTLGAQVSVSLPKNDFALHDGDAPAVLLAGGIGVTPIISFAAELTRRGTEFSLHYATRSAAVSAFGDVLRDRFGAQLQQWHDDCTPIDLGRVIGSAPQGAHVYCCGPKGMIDAVRAQCETLGIPGDHVHFELFTTPQAQSGDQPFEVEISSTGQVFDIPADKTIVDVLEEAGVDVIFDCQRGDCGICQTDVLEGEPDHRDVVLSDAERAAGNVMQICVSRAKSARLVLDL